ncbi:MAG: hypothetical protein J7499_01045 [Sphingopyxis sp.]|nr:hypothetical protein [Sphingopyxis sp.]
MGLVLALAMVVLDIIVAITRSTPPRLAAPPFTREQFPIFPFIAIGLFGLFVGCAFAARRRPAYHKRYMLLATINVVFPAFSRMTGLIPVLPRGATGAIIFQTCFWPSLRSMTCDRAGGFIRRRCWAAR